MEKGKSKVALAVASDRTLSKSAARVGKSMAAIKSLGALKSLGAFKSTTSRMMTRRPTFGFGGVPGIRPVERTSQLGWEFKRPIMMFLNTYQLDPLVKFSTVLVQRAADELLDELYTGHVYHAQESPALALRLAGDLMRRVKTMEFNRYRVITIVSLAQKRAQSYNNAISFLWDHERDNYINVQRETNTSFIQVTAFGVYLD